MDDVDRKLMLLLFEDPRMPVSVLAKRLGISRQAANHHLRMLAAAGVFRDITAALSNYYVGGVPVMLWGRSKTTSLDKVLDGMGRSDFTASVKVAGGNELIVFAYLRKMTDLARYVDFVRSTAEMSEPTVGFPCYGDGINPLVYDGGTPRSKYKSLSKLDLKIIRSLREDARKPIGKIGKEVHASPKTVARHIQRMRSEGSLDYDSGWDIPSGLEMVTVLYVTLKKNVNRVKSARRLLAIDPIHLVLLRAMSNLPSFLMGLITTNKMTEIRKIIKLLQEDKDVLEVTPNLIYQERGYDAWDYKLVREGIGI